MKIDRLLSLTLRLQSIFDFEILFSKKNVNGSMRPLLILVLFYVLYAVFVILVALIDHLVVAVAIVVVSVFCESFLFFLSSSDLFLSFLSSSSLLSWLVFYFPERSPLPTLDCFSLCANFFFLRYLDCILPPRPPKPHCVSIIDFPKSEFPAQYIA